MQNECGGHGCNDRNHVDVHAGLYRSQDAHGQVPGDKAEGGRAQSQKQEVQQICGICKLA